MDRNRRDLPGLAVSRPVLVTVLNLLIVVAGLAAVLGVEVRELPNVDRPVVTVRADFEGAAPETVDRELTSVLEGAVARVAGVSSIRAQSEEGNARVVIEFYPEIDLDIAANDVREAVSRVEARLPDAVENLQVVKADADASAIIRLAAISDVLEQEALTRLVEDQVATALAGVPGVATVEIFGARQRVLRVVVDPMRLASFGLSVDDVATTLRTARFDVPAGSFRSDQQELIVRADASVSRVAEAERLVVRGTTRLSDVADVFFGPADAHSYVRLDGHSIVGIGIVRQARSNTIAISGGIEEAVTRLNASYDELRIVTTGDDAVFIRGAIVEVLISLGLAVLVVVAVIYLFLGSLRATLIPAVAIPVALVGTVAAIWLLGFSINLMTLLALVLATGLVVDDAIVVVENVERRRSEGMGPLAAAVLGTRQVFFAVVATTATLAAVFVPISFIPGAVGRLFTEFGFVLAIAVALSSFVALSLCAMLASRLPQASIAAPARLARLGDRLGAAYRRALGWALGAPMVTLAAALAVAALAAGLYPTLQRELTPAEDRGSLFITLQGPDGVGLDYMDRQVSAVEALIQPLVDEGAVEYVYSITGRWDPNRGSVIATLAPWASGRRSEQQLAAELQPKLMAIPGARVVLRGANSLGIGGGGQGLSFALTGTSYPRLAEAGAALERAIDERLVGVQDVNMSYSATKPQLSVLVDRERASDLGIPMESLSATLRAMVGGYQVAEITVEDEAVPIMLNGKAGAVDDPEDLRNLYVPASDGRLIPLSSLVTLSEEGVPGELDRYAQRRAVRMGATLAPGHSLRDAMQQVEALAKEVLPQDTGILFLGDAAALEEAAGDTMLIFAVAIVVVLLVLAAQFESFASALVILVTVPFGVAAAIWALFLTGTSLNVYSQIGLVMLVGLMAKNGILVVEFANQLRDRGMSVAEAAREAAIARLRPVAMTMVSTIVGGLPLILGSGPGAAARASIGWIVFGGLGIAAVFTLFLTPVAYALLAGMAKPRADSSRRLEAELEEAEAASPPALRRAAE